MRIDKVIRIRQLMMISASAAVLGGCMTVQPNTAYQGGVPTDVAYTRPPPLRNMSDTRPVERPRIAMTEFKERYPAPSAPPRFVLQQATGLFDEAVAANTAIGDSAPDGSFRLLNSQAWVWVSEGGDMLIVEGEGAETVQYLFSAETDTPALILTQTEAYAFDDDALIGAFTPAGTPLSPAAFAASANAAQRLLIRGRALFFASVEPAPRPDYVRRDNRSSTLVTFSTWLLPSWSGFDPGYDRYRQRRESRDRHGRWDGERRRRHDRDHDGRYRDGRDHDGRDRPGGPDRPRHGSGGSGGGSGGDGSNGGYTGGRPGRPGGPDQPARPGQPDQPGQLQPPADPGMVIDRPRDIRPPRLRPDFEAPAETMEPERRRPREAITPRPPVRGRSDDGPAHVAPQPTPEPQAPARVISDVPRYVPPPPPVDAPPPPPPPSAPPLQRLPDQPQPQVQRSAEDVNVRPD